MRPMHTTILVVCEGLTEKIFVEYIRGIYSEGKAKVRVISADGKGPDNVIKHAMTIFKQDGYNHCCALLDLDLPWPPKLVKAAKAKKIVLIGSNPCIEGLFLDILSNKVPIDSLNCKHQFNTKKIGDNSIITKAILSKIFTKEILESRRENIKALNDLLRCMEGEINEVIKDGGA